MRRTILIVTVLVVFVGVGVGIALLLTNVIERQLEAEVTPVRVVEIGPLEIDPAVWGQNFPRQFERWQRTDTIYGRTAYAGATDPPFDKLAQTPFKRMAWAGMPFSVDFNMARGHAYAQIDQASSRRTTEFQMPGACLNCHSGDFVALVDDIGWEALNRTPYDDLRHAISDRGVNCIDCHDPATMDLRITRPHLINALEERGVDLERASRQEMRSLVCAQCHVEYYFRGPEREVVLPWSQGLSVEGIERHFDEYGFADWTHELTGAPMIKLQHPEYELFTTSVHYARGVACADCHMPYIRDGSVKVSDHWIRSPLTNVAHACQTCHRIPEDELRASILTAQSRTASLQTAAEVALEAMIDAIVASIDAGVPDEALEDARQLHRASQLRWDFVIQENSTGFHSPQEAARILAHAIDLARQGELSARLALAEHRAVELGAATPR